MPLCLAQTRDSMCSNLKSLPFFNLGEIYIYFYFPTSPIMDYERLLYLHQENAAPLSDYCTYWRTQSSVTALRVPGFGPTGPLWNDLKFHFSKRTHLVPGAEPGTEDMATDTAPSLPVVKKSPVGTSLVVQWLRLCLPMQGTPVWSLVREVRSHVPQGQLSPCTTAREKLTTANDPMQPNT